MVVLASADAPTRRMWRAALGTDAAVREASDRASLLRVLRTARARLALIDVALPGLGGARGIATIVGRSARTRVIAMAAQPTDADGIVALRAGARGYCASALPPALLRKAVVVVDDGEIWAGRALIARLVEQLGSASRKRAGPAAASAVRALGALTPREREIALLVGEGAANKEIADRLDVTQRTVKAHLTAIFRKLGIGDRLRLALLVTGAASLPRGPTLDRSTIYGARR